MRLAGDGSQRRTAAALLCGAAVERLFPGRLMPGGSGTLLMPGGALEEASEVGRLWRYFAGRERTSGTLAAMERARHLRRGRLSRPGGAGPLWPLLHVRLPDGPGKSGATLGTSCSTACGQGPPPGAGFEAPGDRHVSPLSAGKRGPGRSSTRAAGRRCSSQSCGSWSGNIRTATPRSEIDGYQEKKRPVPVSLSARLRTAAYAIVEDMAGGAGAVGLFPGGL